MEACYNLSLLLPIKQIDFNAVSGRCRNHSALSKPLAKKQES